MQYPAPTTVTECRRLNRVREDKQIGWSNLTYIQQSLTFAVPINTLIVSPKNQPECLESAWPQNPKQGLLGKPQAFMESIHLLLLLLLFFLCFQFYYNLFSIFSVLICRNTGGKAGWDLYNSVSLSGGLIWDQIHFCDESTIHFLAVTNGPGSVHQCRGWCLPVSREFIVGKTFSVVPLGWS